MRACPGPVGAALQGDRVFAAVIEVGVWRRVHPGLASILNPTTGVLMRDMGGGGSGMTRPPGVGRGRRGLPESLRGSVALPAWTSSLQACGMVGFCCLKLRVCGDLLWQPRERMGRTQLVEGALAELRGVTSCVPGAPGRVLRGAGVRGITAWGRPGRHTRLQCFFVGVFGPRKR